MKRIDTTGWTRMDFIDFYTKVWRVPVVPISESKKPSLRTWVEYQERMPTVEELQRWFVKQSPWGLAIVCTGGLFSIDLDSEEIYRRLRQAGAFPQGTCICRTAKGYHCILRATDMLPFSVKQYGVPDLPDFAINGNKALSILPDTPQREWIELYDEPAAVEYEAWLRKYIGWTGGGAVQGIGGRWPSSEGWIPEILCPWHEDDGKPHKPSLHVNLKDGGFICHGCGKQGKLTELVEYSKAIYGYSLPPEVLAWVDSFYQRSQSESKEYHFPTLKELKARAGAVSDLIPNMLSRGQIVVYYGLPKVGKTMQCQDMAACLIVHDPIFGIFPIEQAFRVAYMSFEMSAQELIQRFEIRTQGRGMENLRVERYSGAKFPDRELIDTLRAGTKNFRPDVMFLDPLINMHRLNENSAQDMSSVIDPIREDAEAKGYGVILTHHTGTPKFDEAGRLIKPRPRGSTAIEASADLTIAVKTSGSGYVRTIETDLIRSIGVREWKYKIIMDPQTLTIRPVLIEDVFGEGIVGILAAAGGKMLKAELVRELQFRTGLSQSRCYAMVGEAISLKRIRSEAEQGGQMVWLC